MRTILRFAVVVDEEIGFYSDSELGCVTLPLRFEQEYLKLADRTNVPQPPKMDKSSKPTTEKEM